ncbi:hypothetical protein J2129_001427 [Methanofollis sp. W23]|nr:hypothetical protein [Methanofollis sp. W23]
MVQGEFFPCSISDMDTLIPSNAAWKTEVPSDVRGASTTVRPVRVKGKTSGARVRTVRTVEKTAAPSRPDQSPLPSSSDQKKQVLNPAAVESLRHLQEDFQKDASVLLKEMNMDHLIARKEKESR